MCFFFVFQPLKSNARKYARSCYLARESSLNTYLFLSSWYINKSIKIKRPQEKSPKPGEILKKKNLTEKVKKHFEWKEPWHKLETQKRFGCYFKLNWQNMLVNLTGKGPFPSPNEVLLTPWLVSLTWVLVAKFNLETVYFWEIFNL